MPISLDIGTLTLISAPLLGCFRMSPLHDVALVDVERPMTLREKLPYACAESDSYTIKIIFYGHILLQMA